MQVCLEQDAEGQPVAIDCPAERDWDLEQGGVECGEQLTLPKGIEVGWGWAGALAAHAARQDTPCCQCPGLLQLLWLLLPQLLRLFLPHAARQRAMGCHLHPSLQVPSSCPGLVAPCNSVPSLPSVCDTVVVVKKATPIRDFEASSHSACLPWPLAPAFGYL